MGQDQMGKYCRYKIKNQMLKAWKVCVLKDTFILIAAITEISFQVAA
jgi:hypothetical protein